VPAGIVIPPGQNVFQYANAVLQNLEAQRVQANNFITAVQSQQINQLAQNLNLADQIAQSLVDKVAQAKAQFNTDVTNGASIQTQIQDLAQIQFTGLAATAGVSQIAQFRQVLIQQTIQQLQLDAQLRFSIDSMIVQQETSFLNQILPAIIAAQQAINNLPPNVGPALQANATVIYFGTFTSSVGPAGEGIFYSTALSTTVTVGANGVTLTGPANVLVTTTIELTGQTTTQQSISGAINASLAAPNSTAVKGAFTFNFGSAGTRTAPFVGFIGLNSFVGQITDPSSGVVTNFTLNMVPPPSGGGATA
jgi:hypothetical protein